VPLGDPVADAPRTRVQEQPDPLELIDRDLDEVVARTQRAELQIPLPGVGPGSKPTCSAATVRSSSRASVCSRLIRLFAAPAESGTARSIASRSGRRTAGSSSTVYGVRTAIMPQPMSTPTAAGMIAPRVGMTDPTVAPRPRCASGISARCGWMNGIEAVVIACWRVPSSRMDAQLKSALVICSIVFPLVPSRHGDGRGAT
jgi:hypothetical protein